MLALQANISTKRDNDVVAKGVINKTIETFTQLDILINNAQVSAAGVPLAEHTTKQFNHTLYSGSYVAFHFMKYAYPYLKETKGTVFSLASGVGLFGNFGRSPFAAAKEGIRGLLRVAATE